MLRLDPSLPLVWRTPFSLQIGVLPTVVVLDEPTAADEAVLAYLKSGASHATLQHLHSTLGGGKGSCDALLSALGVALLISPTDNKQAAPDNHVVLIDADESVFAKQLHRSLHLLGHRATFESGGETFAVLSRKWVTAPAQYRRLLSSDIPHINVTFTGYGAQLGPLVIPGTTACLRCHDLERCDEDSRWPAIATQLQGQPAFGCTPREMHDAAALTASVVDDFLVHGSSAFENTLTTSRLGNQQVVNELKPHPRCGCQSPPKIETAAVPERPNLRKVVAAPV